MMFQNLLVFGIGLLEWLLATTRTIAIIKKKACLVVSIVFLENILSLAVLSFFIKTGDWWIAISYAAGAALGSLLPMKFGGIKNVKT